jgi:hypothetical protein
MGVAMHEELWAGVDRKISNAGFFLEEMGRSLQPPRRAITAGVIPDMPLQWERSFYASLDAFLVTARSVPEVINCCFGKDTATSEMKKWFGALAAAERGRRNNFLKQYQGGYDHFSDSPLKQRTEFEFPSNRISCG